MRVTHARYSIAEIAERGTEAFSGESLPPNLIRGIRLAVENASTQGAGAVSGSAGTETARTVVTCAYVVGRRWWAKVDVECVTAFPFSAGTGRVLFRVMKAVASRPLVTARPLALPNLLTYARIAAVPVVVACLYWQDILQGGLWLRWVALAIFVAAGVTDVLDGYFARKWGEQSTFGRMLDPIADKLLVASCLLMLAADGTIRGWSLLAAIVIL